MTSDNTHHKPLGDRILDLDNPVYGDERQRTVTLEACALAYTVMTRVLVVVALAFAVTGAPLVGAVVFALALYQGAVATNYARRKGVDFTELVAAYAPRAGRRAGLVMWLAMVAFAAASIYWMHTGHGLLPVDWTPEITPRDGALRSALTGAFYGAMGGGLFGLLLSEITRRRRRAATTDGDDQLD